MKLFVPVMVILLAVSCNNQADKTAAPVHSSKPRIHINEHISFSHLQELVIDAAEGVKVYYNPEVTEIINKKIKENDFLYDEDTPGDLRVLTTKIDTSEKGTQLLVFSYGVDKKYPLFGFFSNDVTMSFTGPVPGIEIYIPGNGEIYTVSRPDNSSKKFETFKLRDDTIIYVKNRR